MEDFILGDIEVSDSLKDYLEEIRMYKLLEPEEEMAIAKRALEGDELAKQQLVKANLRLVVNVAKAYLDQGVRFMDLIKKGNVALKRAANKFDCTMGFKFVSYAIWWIRTVLEEAIADQEEINSQKTEYIN